MKKRYWFLIIMVGLLLVALIYNLNFLSKDEKFTLDELRTLDKVDQIKIFHEDSSTGESYLVKTVEDLQQIKLIVSSFRTYADDWQFEQVPASPPGPLKVKFYWNNELITSIDITHYATASGSTSSYLSKFPGPSRLLEEREFRELINILEVDENLATRSATSRR